jgi:hypothetical protein
LAEVLNGHAQTWHGCCLLNIAASRGLLKMFTSSRPTVCTRTLEVSRFLNRIAALEDSIAIAARKALDLFRSAGMWTMEARAWGERARTLRDECTSTRDALALWTAQNSTH